MNASKGARGAAGWVSLAFVAAGLLPRAALATTCSGELPPPAAAAQFPNGAIFVGVVTRNRVRRRVQTVTFRVLRAWRGAAAGSAIAVEHAAHFGSLPLEAGQQYLVFADNGAQPGRWQLGRCPMYFPIARAGAYERALGPTVP